MPNSLFGGMLKLTIVYVEKVQYGISVFHSSTTDGIPFPATSSSIVASKSGGIPSKVSGVATQANLTNASPTTAGSWPNLAYQLSGLTPPGTQKDVNNYSQVASILPSLSVAIPCPISRFHQKQKYNLSCQRSQGSQQPSPIAVNATSSSLLKVGNNIDIFDMFSMEASVGNGSTDDDTSWANFRCLLEGCSLVYMFANALLFPQTPNTSALTIFGSFK